MGPRSTSIVELLNEVLDESNNSKKKKYPQALKTVTYISKILKYIHFWGKTKNNTYIWNTKTYFWGHVWCCRSAVRAFISHLPSLTYIQMSANIYNYFQIQSKAKQKILSLSMLHLWVCSAIERPSDLLNVRGSCL